MDATCDGQSDLCGHVYKSTDGSTLAGITVEIRDLTGTNWHTQSAADGSYALNMRGPGGGPYTATCGFELASGWECGAVDSDGSAVDYPIDIPEGGKRQDFLVCPEDVYPACLKQH